MSVIFPGFFETNNYFIDEKVAFFKFSNAYRVYDELGIEIGLIRQRLTGGQKMLRLLLNKAMLPFKLEICDPDGNVLVVIKRGWTFWMSKISLTDGEGSSLGFIRQKFTFLKPTFKIFDADDTEIADITGDWKGWNFSIKDERSTGSDPLQRNGMAYLRKHLQQPINTSFPFSRNMQRTSGRWPSSQLPSPSIWY